MYRFCIFILISLFSVAVRSQIPPPKYEFRGVWVATVNNIDWPSKPGLPVKAQKEEAVNILNMCTTNGMNAVILQVRPASDAFYPSNLEPWSKYLSGYPGKGPEPFYDPLQFWIDECHKRGLEFYAWFNPFRVAQNYKEPLAGNHVAFSHPDWVLKYGDRLYFDPGLPETRNFVTKVIADVVTRYDVDGVLFDDYFYPYPLQDDFPDTASFRMYNRAWPEKYKADWRRENTDIFIRQVSQAIKKTKPWVTFGISPFGVWRNDDVDSDGSDTQAGVTSYDNLYANIIRWEKKGWIDFIIPQLYWRIGHPTVDFTTLAKWWDEHRYGRSLYIGLGIYKIDPKSATREWASPDEIPGQIRTIRSIPGIEGSAFYSSNHFTRNLLGLQDSLQTNLYSQPAVIPPMTWIDSIPPATPERFKKRGKKIKWTTPVNQKEMDKPTRFVIYVRPENEKTVPFRIYSICVGNRFKFTGLNHRKKKYEVRISALDRLNNESKATGPVIIRM